MFTSCKNGAINVVLFYDNQSSAQYLDLIEWNLTYQGITETHKYPKWMNIIENGIAKVRNKWIKN